jgi:hypothetical protein
MFCDCSPQHPVGRGASEVERLEALLKFADDPTKLSACSD